MPHATQIWETLLYALAGTSSGPFAQRRDRILAALREVGFDPAGAAALDDDALEAQPPHRLLIIASDGADDDFTFVAVPEDGLADDLAAALARCEDETIDVGTAADHPDLWTAWVRLALASGARDTDWLTASGDDLPIDADEASALAGLWVDHAFAAGSGGRVPGAKLDRRFTRVTFVLERV